MEEGQEGGREKEKGGTKEGVEGASNKKALRPCPNLRKPFLFAISSQGSEADIQLRLKWSEYWKLNSKLARSPTRKKCIFGSPPEIHVFKSCRSQKQQCGVFLSVIMPFGNEYSLDNQKLKDQSAVGWKWGVRVAFADAREDEA